MSVLTSRASYMRNIAEELGLPGKRCIDCYIERGISAWPLEFFNYNPHGPCAIGGQDPNTRACLHIGCYSAQCAGHILSARTAVDPFERKVTDAFRRHAKQDSITLYQVLQRWGTTVKLEAARMREAYEHGICERREGGCNRPYINMPNGLKDLTYDRRDPTKPFLPNNVTYMCDTCNGAKGRMSPERFAIRHQCWTAYDDTPVQPRYEAMALFDVG